MQYNPLEIGSCYSLTICLVAVWGVLSSAEWLANIKLFKPQGLLSWSVMSLRYGEFNRSSLGNAIFSEASVRNIAILRFAASAALLFFSAPVVNFLCLLLIVFSCFYFTYRTGFGGDGSDQMGAVISFGSLLMSAGLALDDVWLARSGAFAIAGQAAISYFIAGFAKFVSPVWRGGRALSGVMNTQTYGHVAAARIASSMPLFAGFFCWVVILTEMAFPLLFFVPNEILLLGLLGFAAFHISNAIFMGLNAFVISFIGTYPSVVFFNYLLR